MIPGQRPQFFQRFAVDIELALIAAGVDKTGQFRCRIEPGLLRRGLDFMQALAGVGLCLVKSFTAALCRLLQFGQESGVLQQTAGAVDWHHRLNTPNSAA